MSDKRMPAFFLADDMGLDFLNSIATPVDTPIDWLDTGEGLLGWLEQAELVPLDVLTSFRKDAVPGELDAVAAQARALREWFREFVQAHKGKPLRGKAIDELAVLNQVLARDEEFGQVVVTKVKGESKTSGLEWRLQRRWRSPDSLLLPVARAMANLVCTADFTYVKKCESPTCSLMFVDRTNRRARRWCSMATCGNRAKQAAHRARVQNDD
ncbi:CGNR zinc finger domain-containing protein [Undibacterium sp. TJN25]|uniref:CGNR zinc finger domain-containing protein n=1 Tax=Undibacterium sp. TJN25 TaxID=3413056 RepID=UPI003BEF5C1A